MNQKEYWFEEGDQPLFRYRWKTIHPKGQLLSISTLIAQALPVTWAFSHFEKKDRPILFVISAVWVILIGATKYVVARSRVRANPNP